MNFILRQFKTDGSPFNTMLGNSYSLIKKYSEVKRSKSWLETLRMYYPDIKDEYTERVVAVIITDKSFLIDEPCYIMTENGATFEKI